MAIAAGTRFDRYEVISRPGAGGMGEVWRAALDSTVRSPSRSCRPGLPKTLTDAEGGSQRTVSGSPKALTLRISGRPGHCPES